MASEAITKSEAVESLDRMRNMMANVRRKAEEQTRTYLATGIQVGASFALGAADARWGEAAAFGMSTTLAAGLVGHGLALLDVGGKEGTPILQAIGNAGLGAYAYKQGFDLMQRRMSSEGEGTD
jgi:hypothetical protein